LAVNSHQLCRTHIQEIPGGDTILKNEFPGMDFEDDDDDMGPEEDEEMQASFHSAEENNSNQVEVQPNKKQKRK
jgi:hypothetical protein